MSEDTFEMSVSGKGTLQGMWFSHAFQRYNGKATIYDATETFKKHQANEAAIGEAYGDANAKAQAKKIRANVATPKTRDVDVEFLKHGKSEVAIITGKGRKRVVKLDLSKMESQGPDHAMEEIAKAVDEILGFKPSSPRFIKKAGKQPAMS